MATFQGQDFVIGTAEVIGGGLNDWIGIQALHPRKGQIVLWHKEIRGAKVASAGDVAYAAGLVKSFNTK